MKIISAAWTRFSVPFVRPFTTAHGTLTERQGLLVRLLTDDGRTGLGEASPIPPFGGTLHAVERHAQGLLASVMPWEVSEFDPLDGYPPAQPAELAAWCAVDTALHDLWAQLVNISVAQKLDGPAGASVPVNATIGAAATETAVAAATRAVADGFRCAKLKVGVCDSPEAELERIGAVRQALGPGIGLRLDANGAWRFEEAVAILQAAAQFDLEYVEQPVAARDIDRLGAVKARVPVPIAADEAVSNSATLLQVIQKRAADFVIIKPLVAGGPRLARAEIDLLKDAAIKAVVTTTIDGGVGIAAALHLAACLPEPRLACGLATASLLENDLLAEPLPVVDGCMRVPSGPGLGVALSEASVARYCNGWHEVTA